MNCPGDSLAQIETEGTSELEMAQAEAETEYYGGNYNGHHRHGGYGHHRHGGYGGHHRHYHH